MNPGEIVEYDPIKVRAFAPTLYAWLKAHVEAYGKCECRPDGIVCPHCRAESLLAACAPSEARRP